MGEKKRRLAAGEPPRVRFDARLLGSAFDALQRGDRNAADSAFARLHASVPDDPEVLNACGVLALQLGRDEVARELLTRAVALSGANPAYRCHLAIAYRRLGEADLAIDELQRTLAIDPGIAEAHANLGNVLLERGDYETARHHFEHALAIRPDYPEARNGLGDAQLNLGDYDGACANLERAIVADPRFHEARYNLSRAYALRAVGLDAQADDHAGASATSAELALESILAALELDPENPLYLRQFENCVKDFELQHPVDPRVRATLLRALGHPAVDPARLVRPVVSLVSSHPDGVALKADSGSSTESGTSAAPASALGDPLLRRLLEEVIVPYPSVQSLCAAARRAALDEWRSARKLDGGWTLDVLSALAQQAFNTEYSNEESDDERAGVDELGSAIGADRAPDARVPSAWYALYACYRSLAALAAPQQKITADLDSTPLRELSIRQIAEPAEERRLRASIAPLTDIADVTSVAVQSQYEANPYPRWIRVRHESPQRSLGVYLRKRFPHSNPDDVAEGPARILIAGCGTGRHPIWTALRFPGAQVLAIDLSLTSLAYALRRTRELGVANVEYRQADILGLGSLSERFDLIESVGVLHHLADPVAGWSVLTTLLAPRGAMRIGLYSELARRHVARARALVEQMGVAPTPEGIRAFRREVLRRTDDPLLVRLTRSEDFYSLSGVRDLAFNVQEHRFVLADLARILAELRLEFLGFDLPDQGIAAAYRAQFAEDISLTDLDRWQKFEERRPDTFAQMYQFWVRRPPDA